MKTRTFFFRATRLAHAAVLLAAAAAYGAEIKVMTTGAFTAVYLELKTQFEEATGGKVITVTTIPKRLERGESTEVVIVDDTALDRLIVDGRVVARSKAKLARSVIGMVVRAGAPRPDISSIAT